MYQFPSGPIDTSQSPLGGCATGMYWVNVLTASVENHKGDGWVKPPWLHARMVWPSGLTCRDVSASPPIPTLVARNVGRTSSTEGASMPGSFASCVRQPDVRMNS